MGTIDIFQDLKNYIGLSVLVFSIVMMSASITINDLNIFGTLKVKRLRFICKSIFNTSSKKLPKKNNIK